MNSIVKILVVITDGIRSRNWNKTLSVESFVNASNKLKANGVDVFVVGVGDDVELNQIKKISSGADKMFQSENFDDLRKVVKEIATRLCKGITTRSVMNNNQHVYRLVLRHPFI